MLTRAAVFNKAFLSTGEWTCEWGSGRVSIWSSFYCSEFTWTDWGHDLAATDGRLTKLFMGGSGLILRPAQPPFLCHRPLDGLMPSQRFRPALPMTRLLWSTLDTLPTVTIHVSSTWREKRSEASKHSSISCFESWNQGSVTSFWFLVSKHLFGGRWHEQISNDQIYNAGSFWINLMNLKLDSKRKITLIALI